MTKVKLDRLRKHIIGELNFEIEGDTFTIIPKVKDKITLLEKVASVGKDGSMRVFREYLISQFTEVVDEPDTAVIEDFVDSNLDELIKQLTIGFKIAKKSDFEVKDKDPNLM